MLYYYKCFTQAFIRENQCTGDLGFDTPGSPTYIQKSGKIECPTTIN